MPSEQDESMKKRQTIPNIQKLPFIGKTIAMSRGKERKITLISFLSEFTKHAFFPEKGENGTKITSKMWIMWITLCITHNYSI